MAVSLAVFCAILRWVLRSRPVRPNRGTVAGVAGIVVIGGMLFARHAANLGVGPAFYYGLPARLTIALPPVAFRMRARETLAYVLLALASSPAIHVVFSVFVDWHEYLPFWKVPSIWALRR